MLTRSTSRTHHFLHEGVMLLWLLLVELVLGRAGGAESLRWCGGCFFVLPLEIVVVVVVAAVAVVVAALVVVAVVAAANASAAAAGARGRRGIPQVVWWVLFCSSS